MKSNKMYIKDDSFLDKLQYFLSIFIAILFGLGLVPFVYLGVFKFVMILILIQIIISAIRLRILNVIIELLLLGLGLFSLIPILGYLTRFFGILVSILEASSFKNSVIYQTIEINTINKFKSKKNKSKKDKSKKEEKLNSKNIVDAEFEEK